MNILRLGREPPSLYHWTVALLVLAAALSALGFSAQATSAFGLDGGLSREQPPSRPEQIWDNPLLRPAFDNTTETNIVASTGRVAYLHCRVNHLGNRVVTWLRKRDAHVLTSGLFSYTNDQRFTALHAEGSPDWVLKITYPQTRDSGIYECQVSTEPKISKFYTLNVVESVAVIEGSRDKHMSAGNTLNLTCSTTVSGDLPTYFYWYHNDKVVQYTGKKDVSVHTADGRTQLIVRDVGPKHSGNYTCAPENAAPATVTVFVLSGAAALTTFLRAYDDQVNSGANMKDCAPYAPPLEGETCFFKTNLLGRTCQRENSWGYDKGSPCVLITFDKEVSAGWVPDVYTDLDELPPEMPLELRLYITNVTKDNRGFIPEMVWVSCTPEDPSDQAHLGAIEYSPWRGFPKYYFPIRNEAPYLAPIVAVQFLKPATRRPMTVECRAWSKNMVYSRAEGYGLVRFHLTLD